MLQCARKTSCTNTIAAVIGVAAAAAAAAAVLVLVAFYFYLNLYLFWGAFSSFGTSTSLALIWWCLMPTNVVLLRF